MAVLLRAHSAEPRPALRKLWVNPEQVVLTCRSWPAGLPLAQRKSTRLLWLLFQLLQFFLHQHLLLFLGQLGKQERNLQPHGPVRSICGMQSVGVALSNEAHRLRPELR